MEFVTVEIGEEKNTKAISIKQIVSQRSRVHQTMGRIATNLLGIPSTAEQIVKGISSLKRWQNPVATGHILLS